MCLELIPFTVGQDGCQKLSSPVGWGALGGDSDIGDGAQQRVKALEDEGHRVVTLEG